MLTMIRRHILLALSALLLATLATPTVAQEYPRKQPIRLIVPQAAGSATDIMARALSARLTEALGQQIIIDNRPGAGGVVGTDIAAKAPADGYTLAVGNISTHGVNPSLYKKLPYDPLKDFAPISMTATTGNVLIVHAGLPFKTIADLIAHARAHPDTLQFASAGQGSSQHLAAELFNAMAGGLKMLHVPYRGTPPGLTAVMGGEIAWMLPSIPSGMTAIKTGRARPLGVSTASPHPELPGVPLIKETLPGFEVTTWFGIVAPARTPEAIVQTLNAAIGKALAHPDTRQAFSNAGLDPTHSTPEAFGNYVRSEIARWSNVVKDANITAE